jgi:hypothetical protein
MTHSEQLIRELLAALKSQVHSCFPKACSCGRVYRNLDEFLENTRPTGHSGGLLRGIEFSDTGIMSILRNCACHSTLLAVFSERRDMSPKGAKVRLRFAQVVHELKEAGMEPEAARTDLADAMRGVINDRLRPYLAGNIQESVGRLTDLVSASH